MVCCCAVLTSALVRVNWQVNTALMCLLGRRIQTHEHNSVEDARASMELFKRVQSEWKTEADEPRKKSSSKPKNGSLKRQCTDERCFDVARPCAKQQRLDTESWRFLSDHYWPADIQVCWFWSFALFQLNYNHEWIRGLGWPWPPNARTRNFLCFETYVARSCHMYLQVWQVQLVIRWIATAF